MLVYIFFVYFDHENIPIKIIEGCAFRAIWNSAFTIFSPSPTHLDMIVEAEMLKKVHRASSATAFA